MRYDVLVLNADFMPFDVISWRDGFAMLFNSDDSNAYAIEYYQKIIKDSVGREYEIPAVIALKKYVHVDHKNAPYSKRNILARDKYTCQYCRRTLHRKDLTLDHVIPKSRWKSSGRTGRVSSFENVVTACKPCNSLKDNRTPEEAGMKLLKKPDTVTRRQAFINRVTSGEQIPAEWLPYLPESVVNVPQ